MPWHRARCPPGVFVDEPLAFGHHPGGLDAALARFAFKKGSLLVSVFLTARHSGDDDHVGLAVEEHLLGEILEAVGLN